MNNDEDKANCMTTAMDRGPVYFALWCRYHGIDPTPLMRRHCVNTARAWKAIEQLEKKSE